MMEAGWKDAPKRDYKDLEIVQRTQKAIETNRIKVGIERGNLSVVIF